MKAATLGQAETTTTPTEFLINLMRMRESDEQQRSAEAAFKSLCNRFGPNLLRRCRQVVRRHGRDPALGDDIANMALQRFWANRSFDPNKVEPAKLDGAVRLYLYRTAERLLFDLHEDEHAECPYDGSEEVVENVEAFVQRFPVNDVDEVTRIIEEAMSGLSWKHRVIFFTYQRYAKEGFKMPRPLLKKLREHVGLPQNTVQFYKKEAFDRFNSRLETRKAHGTQATAIES